MITPLILPFSCIASTMQWPNHSFLSQIALIFVRSRRLIKRPSVITIRTWASFYSGGAEMHLFGKINSSEGVLFLTGGDHSFLKVEFTSNLRPLYIIQLNRKNFCKTFIFFTILLSFLIIILHTLYIIQIHYK